MLRVIIEETELFNEHDQTFETVESVVLDLEHSLVSLSKWESEFQKPFLSSGRQSIDEVRSYLKAMVITPDVDQNVIDRASPETLDKIQSYINSTQSATTFGEMPKQRSSGEIITSELIYYWMLTFNIPFECQFWHLNRLFALIRICNIKNTKQKKMSRHEIAERNRELNAKRRAEMGTAG